MDDIEKEEHLIGSLINEISSGSAPYDGGADFQRRGFGAFMTPPTSPNVDSLSSFHRPPAPAPMWNYSAVQITNFEVVYCCTIIFFEKL